MAAKAKPPAWVEDIDGSFVLIVFLIGIIYSGFSCVVVQVVSPSLSQKLPLKSPLRNYLLLVSSSSAAFPHSSSAHPLLFDREKTRDPMLFMLKFH